VKHAGLEPSSGADLPPALEAYEAGALLRVSAACGALAWLGHRWFADTELITSTLAFALLVIVPLALSLFRPSPRELGVFSWSTLLQPVAAIGALTALTLEPRSATALFALPWLVFTGLVAAVGSLRLASQSGPADLAHGLGCLLLPVGGLWFCMSRAGLDPLGMGRMMVLLTALHFHFVAFAALAIFAAAAERLARLSTLELVPQRTLAVTRVGIVAQGFGTFLVAAAASGVPTLGLAGAVLTALALFAHAYTSLRYLWVRVPGGMARLCLLISSLSVLVSVPLAIAWTWGQITGREVLDFTWMLRLHGMVNAHGFVLCGLLAFWLWLRSEARVAVPRERGQARVRVDVSVED